MKKYLIILMALVLPVAVEAQEMYKVLSTDGKTLTFYYDEQKDSREGTVFTVEEEILQENATVITKAVFDPSFADARPTSTKRWFYGMEGLVSIENLSVLNTSDVTDMSLMFCGCEKLTSLDVSHFNTSNVTDMWSMFFRCISLTTLDVSNFDTSKVTNMSYMFFGGEKLTSLDLSNFDTSKVTDMCNMFYYCINLTSLNVSSFNTSNVTNMGNMFYKCSNLPSLDVSNFDTSKVTDMSRMFWECGALTSLDLSHFNTGNVESMYYMFNDCKSLTSLDLTHFDTSKVMFMSFMFFGCNKLKSLDLSNFDTSKVTTMSYMFYGCSNLTSLDVSSFDTSNVTDMNSMFAECNSLTALDVSRFNTSKVTNMNCMFDKCRVLTSLDVSHFDTSNVTDMNHMFYACKGLTALDVSHFDTSNVTSMSFMFYFCEGLTSLHVRNFNTSNVTDMSYMFSDCYGLTSLDLSHFDTSNVTNMRNMFTGCLGLIKLDLSFFDTSKVTNMTEMFKMCENLTTIYCYGDWSLSKVLENSDNMFWCCYLLQGGNGTKYGDTHVKVAYAHPDTKANPGYFTMKTPFNFGPYSFRLENDDEGVTGAVLTGRNTVDPRPFTDEEIGSSYISIGGAMFKVFAIGDEAFESDQSTEPLNFTRPLFRNITRVGEHAFNGCKASTLDFYWPAIETIGDYAFANTSIREFQTSGRTGNIGKYAFQNCTQLEHIRSMGMFWSQDLRFKERCFQNCTALKTIEISDGTKGIEEKAFAGCTALQRVTVDHSTPLAIPANVFEGSNANATLRVPENSEEAYGSAQGWNYFKKINSTDMGATFEDAVFSYVIGNVMGNTSAIINGLSSTFKGTVAKLPARNVEYEGATFPVEMVNDEAFFGNETLTEVDLTVLERTETDDEFYWWRLDIGRMAFSGCENLQSFKCDVTCNVGEQAFAGSGLKTIDLPHLEYGIAKQAFNGCKELTTVTVGSNYSPTIGELAFANCPKLSSFVMHKFYGRTSDKVFYNDVALTSVTLSEGVTIDGSKTFQKCKNLRKVVSENPNPEDIAEDTFEDLPEDAVLVVPPGTVELYASKTGWNHFVIDNGDGVVVGISDVERLNGNDEMRNGEGDGKHQSFDGKHQSSEKRSEVYDLQGRKLDSVGAGPVPARLHKGLYIRNGRKVVIK